VEVAEKYADGETTEEELAQAGQIIRQERANGITTLIRQLSRADPMTVALETISAARHLAAHHASTRSSVLPVAKVRLPKEATAFRDIFGNPFRPVAFSPEWRTGTAVSLARTMYESREFSAMPILADALQDAGCDNEDILSHCRGTGPHIRGCWVTDLVLGKQ
jgi:hypothetical protein